MHVINYHAMDEHQEQNGQAIEEGWRIYINARQNQPHVWGVGWLDRRPIGVRHLPLGDRPEKYT